MNDRIKSLENLFKEVKENKALYSSVGGSQAMVKHLTSGHIATKKTHKTDLKYCKMKWALRIFGNCDR